MDEAVKDYMANRGKPMTVMKRIDKVLKEQGGIRKQKLRPGQRILKVSLRILRSPRIILLIVL